MARLVLRAYQYKPKKKRPRDKKGRYTRKKK